MANIRPITAKEQDKILKEIQAEEAWENTIKAQSPEVQAKIRENRKRMEELRRK
jgi:hypothetical protein